MSEVLPQAVRRDSNLRSMAAKNRSWTVPGAWVLRQEIESVGNFERVYSGFSIADHCWLRRTADEGLGRLRSHFPYHARRISYVRFLCIICPSAASITANSVDLFLMTFNWLTPYPRLRHRSLTVVSLFREADCEDLHLRAARFSWRQ